MLKDGSKIVRKEYTKFHKSPKYINMQYYVKKGGLIQIHEFEIYTRNSKRNSYFIDTVFEDRSMRRDRLDYDEEAMASFEAESIILNKTRVDSIEKPNFTCVMYEYEENNMKFQIGDKVKVNYDCKWDKQSVHITDIHTGFNPVLYSCEALDGTKLAFFENELQSLYEHDMDMLKYWGK